MNIMKIALLGTAALAAVSVSASADNLSDLKAQIEALNARVAAVETAPAVPAGFSLMTVSTAPAIVIPGMKIDKNYGTTATQIGIMPTADVEAAPSTVIQWSGYVRAALMYDSREYGTFSSAGPGDRNALDVKFRTEIKVTGKTDTAVGEVGATVKLRAQLAAFGGTNRTKNTATFYTPGAFGYWKLTPELTLGGGLDGSLAGNAFGYDGACNCYYTDNANQGYGRDGDPAQMRLSYASGPLSFAVAIEDGRNHVIAGNSHSSLGVAGEIKYSGDTVSGEVSAGYWGNGNQFGLPEDAYIIDAGLGFALGDMAKISIAGGFGSGYQINDNFYKASILGSVNLSSAAHAEVAYGHVGSDAAFGDQDSVLAGIYYDPVSQLTIGLEGEYIWNEGPDNDRRTVDLVTVFRF